MGCGASAPAAEAPKAEPSTSSSSPAPAAPVDPPAAQNGKADPPKAAPEPVKAEAPAEVKKEEPAPAPAAEVAKPDAAAAAAPAAGAKICIVGPPSSGKGALIEKLVKDKGMVHLRETWLVKNAKAKGVPSVAKAEGVEGPLPDDLMLDILSELMAAESSCVCDGLPKNDVQAEAMAAKGLTAHKLVIVDVSEADLLEFYANRVVDPETMTQYNKATNPPPADVEARCVQQSMDNPEAVQTRIAPYFSTIGKIEAAFGANVIKVKGSTQSGSDTEKAMFDDLCKQLGI